MFNNCHFGKHIYWCTTGRRWYHPSHILVHYRSQMVSSVTSTGALHVADGFILPLFSNSAQTWLIRYIYFYDCHFGRHIYCCTTCRRWYHPSHLLVHYMLQMVSSVTSTGALQVADGIIRPLFSNSAQTWLIRYYCHIGRHIYWCTTCRRWYHPSIIQ